jgi:hypothetical protein
MTITFAAPLAALAGLAGAVPIAVALERERRAAALRGELGLAPPTLRARLARPAALACAFALLGLAAARPSVRTQGQRLVRSDAQLFVVIDNSRSMLAAPTAHAAPRYRRAVEFARRLHLALPQLEAGVGSLNNRLLPYLFPAADTGAFDAVLADAYGILRPPPAPDIDHWVTTFDQLGRAGTRQFFSPGVRKRLLVVLSDGETRPFDARGVLRSLRSHGVIPIDVRFWQPGERIFRSDGKPESYHATQSNELHALRAARWQAYPESRFGAVVDAARRAVGSGPFAKASVERRQVSIAAAFALAAVAPLLLVFLPGRLPRRRSRRAGPVLER